MNIFGSGILDVLIGLALVYLLLALVVTLLQEMVVNRVFNTRSDNLFETLNLWFTGELKFRGWMKRLAATSKGFRKGVAVAADSADFTERVLAHPRIASAGGRSRPSYIPSADFAAAVVATLRADNEVQAKLKGITGAIPGGIEIPVRIRDEVLEIVDSVGGEIDDVRKELARRFDTHMDRLAGVYKRKTQAFLLAISTVLVVVLNADSLVIFQSLQDDPTLRAQLVEAAETRTAAATACAAQADDRSIAECLQEANPGDAGALTASVSKLGVPLGGWHNEDPALDRLAWPDDAWGWIYKAIGLAITAAAVSLGAPFWFNGLQGLLKLRGSGPPPPKAPPAG